MKKFLQKQVRSFQNAFRGIGIACVHELHCKVHLLAMTMVIIAGFAFAVTNYEWIALLLCIAIVVCLELVNTSLEHLVDIVSPNIQTQARNAKDIAAGAVLVASIIGIIVASIIFIPKIANWWNV
ncbi:MAG: diacylglycerol kinase family protein [Paludibacteraceae bacterium]|nr:diacylglycerol kinase family protein [Paludibacteraceae bacterium]MBP6284103.1 diacylglycerol kinase family protein [Paludibacteraceae bacterium]